MRNLLYKNLTFPKRGRKIIASSEVADKEGIHSVVRRHFTYMVKPVPRTGVISAQPYLYVLKQRDNKQRREHFFCKVKGSVLAVSHGNFFQVLFVHTLTIDLTSAVKLSEQLG